MTKATRRWGFIIVGCMLVNLVWGFADPAYPVVEVAKVHALLFVVWGVATTVRAGGEIDV